MWPHTYRPLLTCITLGRVSILIRPLCWQKLQLSNSTVIDSATGDTDIVSTVYQSTAFLWWSPLSKVLVVCTRTFVPIYARGTQSRTSLSSQKLDFSGNYSMLSKGTDWHYLKRIYRLGNSFGSSRTMLSLLTSHCQNSDRLNNCFGLSPVRSANPALLGPCLERLSLGTILISLVLVLYSATIAL